MRRVFLLAAVTILVAANGAVGSAPQGSAQFQTPSHHIACMYGTFGGVTLRCDIAGVYRKPPPGCDLDYGFAFQMARKGHARRLCAGDTVLCGSGRFSCPTVGYGSTWSYGGFTCLSRSVGLRCKNRSGHGFFLSRQRQTIF